MAIATNALPYGLRDVKLTPISSAGALGTMVDLPAARTLTWSESEDFETLRGDDQVQAEHGNGAMVSWDLEQGGISLAAYAVIAGGTVTSTGTTPNVVKTYQKNVFDARPYFRIDGQAINDNGGDTHVIIHKCKATGDIGGEFAEGGFNVTKASGSGNPNASGDLYDVVQNETAADIVQPT